MGSAEIILPLCESSVDLDEATVERVGGKGASLARLAWLGVPVPISFLVTTEAYRAFLATNGIAEWVVATAQSARPDDPAALAAASEAIRARFASGAMPPEVAPALSRVYADLGRPAVAVRSSATAEDLPELSFAGQHETYLNVVDEEALLKAVRDCWSSLWTARAIGYRARNNIAQSEVEMAVVVQQMVASEASGVLFTANPVTGKRNEVVIDATLGLGEALVAGQVEPDHYVVEMPAGRIVEKKLGAKAVAIRPQAGGGTTRVPESGRETTQALPAEVIVEMARLAERIAALYGSPQDVEWAWADGRLWVLQARPITSLYPLPEGMLPEPLQVLFSVGAVQGMLDPFTPLGQDVFLHLLVPAVADRIRLRFDPRNQLGLLLAGERLFVNVTGALRNRLARRRLPAALEFVEPATAHIVKNLLLDPRLAAAPARIPSRAWWRLAIFFLSIFGNVVLNLGRPRARRAWIERYVEEALARLEAGSAAATTLSGRLAWTEETFREIPRVLLPYLLSGIAAGMGSLMRLVLLAEALPEGRRNVLEATRGLPHNVTTEMDLALWALSRAIYADPSSAARFAQADAATLAADYLAGRLPPVAQAALRRFLERYGMRGVAEIDIGRPRWRDDPTEIMQVLQSYLRIQSPELAPDAVFARGAASAEAAIERLVQSARAASGGWWRAPVIRWFAGRMRALAGLRESPKFFIIRVVGVVQAALLASGRELAAQAIIDRPDDVFFLRLEELHELARGGERDWRVLVTARRAAYTREKRRKQIPRLLLSDGHAFYAGVGAGSEAGEGVLLGSPVSPGVAEGAVRVVHDPRGVQLAPGEILVCPGTDPAWTPLFLAAGGLVTEVGGLMTHGSVVAREYGIPAVVGVHEATTRLRTGQRVRVDGSAGRITVLDAGAV